MKKMMSAAGDEVQHDCCIWCEKRWNLKDVATDVMDADVRVGKTLSILTGVVLTAFERSC
jgi:hypothetical protein